MTLRLACLALVALLGAGSAEARRVILMPSVPRSCPGNTSWTTTATCLERFGTPKLVRSQPDLRLVQLHGRAGDDMTSGFYLYVLRDGAWRVGGMLQGRDYTFVAMTTPRIDGHVMYRFDVRHAVDEEVSLDGVSSRPAHVQQQLAVFCAGTNQFCTPVVTSCDVFVGGKSYWAFRGKLVHAERELRVVGDRSKAGGLCAQDETVLLDFGD